MAREEIEMIPRVGDSEVRIPVTLDYSGGRSQSVKTRLMWTAISVFLLIFVEVGILLSAYTFIVKIFLMALLFYVVTLILRVFLLKENKYRKEMKKRIDNDYSINMSDFWGIYEIDGEYCYFLSGHVGMYIMLEKGAIVGKNAEDEYDNYEAIADAYNILGSSRLRVCHVDMMDIIGRDDRIRRAHRNINMYDSSGMKGVLEDIFRFLQKSAESAVTSYDIYLFMYKGDELEFETAVQKVLSCLMSANYSSYTVLDRQRIQSFASSLFNLHDFSVSSATHEAFSKRGSSQKTLTPISLTYPDGTVVEMNKTTEQKRSEARAKAEADKYKKAEIARRNERAKEKKKKDRAKFLQETVSKVSNNRFGGWVSDPTGDFDGGTIDLDEDMDSSNDGFMDFGSSSDTGVVEEEIDLDTGAISNSSSDGLDDDFLDMDMDDAPKPRPRESSREKSTVPDEDSDTGFFDM